MQFEGPLENFVTDYTKALSISRRDFIAGLLTDLMARIAVGEEQDRPQHMLPMFTEVDGEIMKGEALFHHLVQFHRGGVSTLDNIAERTEQILREDKQRHNESNQMKMEQDRGRIPADYDGSPHQALSWLGEHDRGEITAEQLAARWTEHARSAGWQGADDGEK